ncbi:MAG: pilus assembly protein PilM [Pirellulaceae bacterium]|nr:pilus assembly protein PilM [Pirellulaceae bacterium]
MIRRLQSRHCGPIGIDLGAKAVKLIQFNSTGTEIVESACWNLAVQEEGKSRDLPSLWVDAIRQACVGRHFRGRKAIVCLSDRELFIQNIRIFKSSSDEVMERHVEQEAAGRIPFPLAEASLRFIEAGEVRQGDTAMREVILMACHQPVLDEVLAVVEAAGLLPVGVEVEPVALLRSYFAQGRRELDRVSHALYAHVGYSGTSVTIARGDQILFVKYLPLGGKQFDQAVARHLELGLSEAGSLRQHNGDRRADEQDPDIARGIREATREVVSQLCLEVNRCVRYFHVTFRGQSLGRVIVGGGEATDQLTEAFASHLNIKAELGAPLRSHVSGAVAGRATQWDVAAGLALRDCELV